MPISAGTFSVGISESVFCHHLYDCWFIVLLFVPHLLLAYELLIYSRILTANPDGRPCLCPIAYYPVSVHKALKVILFLLYGLSDLLFSAVAFLLCVIDKIPQQAFLFKTSY